MTPITEQLQQMECMAKQHYPGDDIGSRAARAAYHIVLLEQRLREYAARFHALPVKEQK